MTGVMWPPLARTFRRLALPLASYYAVTIAIPLANGASPSNAAFATHALVVLALPPILIVVACASLASARGVSRAFAAQRAIHLT